MEEEPTIELEKEFGVAPSRRIENENGIKYRECQIISKNNKIYNLKIIQNENLILFTLKIVDDLLDDLDNVIYKNELSLEKFYHLDNYFKKYYNCEEIFNLIFFNIRNEHIYITKENNNIKLSFLVGPVEENKIITLILNPKRGVVEKMMWNLCEKIKMIEEKNKINEKLLKELDILKKNFEEENKKEQIPKKLISIKNNKLNIFWDKYKFNINFLICFLICFIIENIFIERMHQKNKDIIDLKITDLQNEINNIKSEITGKKKKIKNDKIYNGIIKLDELSLIEDEIYKIYQQNITNYKLLFRASRDGFDAKEFHKRCNSKAFTITFIKTKNRRRFGGFTEAKWCGFINYTNGKKGFVFSLDNKEIYKNEGDNYNIYCNKSSAHLLEVDPIILQ